MALFESLLALLLVSILLLKISGHMGAPYPAVLAFAGMCVAALPWAPEIDIQPRLALALFIAPGLLDAAYELPPRELLRDWLPLTWLALIAVVLTTAAVAWIGWAWQSMPLAAAIALGAIVAPSDAAAASAVLTKFSLPRRTMAILQGESLLNDATALLIFHGRRRNRDVAGDLGHRHASRPAGRGGEGDDREICCALTPSARSESCRGAAPAWRDLGRCVPPLVEELDWAELHASPREELEMLDA